MITIAHWEHAPFPGTSFTEFQKNICNINMIWIFVE